MDHEVTFVRIGFCKVDLIPLAGLAEVDNVGQILFRRRCNIAVRRSKRVQLQIFLFCIRQTSFKYCPNSSRAASPSINSRNGSKRLNGIAP